MLPEPKSRRPADIRFYVDPVDAGVAVSSAARIVGLAGRNAQRTSWEKVTLLTRHWRAIETFVAEHPDGPWWLSVSQTGVAKADYRV